LGLEQLGALGLALIPAGRLSRGPYEVFGRLPDTEVTFVAEQPGLIAAVDALAEQGVTAPWLLARAGIDA
jgi:hypothetical protein